MNSIIFAFPDIFQEYLLYMSMHFSRNLIMGGMYIFSEVFSHFGLCQRQVVLSLHILLEKSSRVFSFFFLSRGSLLFYVVRSQPRDLLTKHRYCVVFGCACPFCFPALRGYCPTNGPTDHSSRVPSHKQRHCSIGMENHWP